MNRSRIIFSWLCSKQGVIHLILYLQEKGGNVNFLEHMNKFGIKRTLFGISKIAILTRGTYVQTSFCPLLPLSQMSTLVILALQ